MDQAKKHNLTFGAAMFFVGLGASVWGVVWLICAFVKAVAGLFS